MKRTDYPIPYTLEIAAVLDQARESYQAVGRGAVLYDVGPPERGLYLTAAALLAEARAKELPREWLTAAARMLHRYSPRYECVFVIVQGERWQIQLLKRPGAATN